MRKSQKPFPDLSVAVPNLRRTAGLPIWALADRSGLDADLLRRVEANRSRLTPDQFLRVAETCGAGDRADEWRRWAAECPWDFAVADEFPPELQVATTDNLEAWSNMGDTHFDAHIFAIDV